MFTTVQNFSLKTVFFVILSILTLTLSPLLAHGDEDHGATSHTEATVTERTMTIAELEHMLALLQQLLALIVEQKKLNISVVALAEDADHHDDALMDVHMQMSSSTTSVATSTAKKLVIEVETHGSKTHTHVRYIDKPESMFFVDAATTDEDGLVKDIVAKTGLSADEVKKALVYMQ